MEKRLNTTVELLLQEMALRKIVVNLWNKNDIFAVIEVQGFFEKSTFFEKTIYEFERCAKQWQNCVEYRVKNKVLELALPEFLKHRLISLIRPIGSDILKWRWFHENYLSTYKEYCRMNFLKHLHWTCRGAIDYPKTAEELIRLKTLDSVKRYKLACYYCLVEYIPLLWDELDDENRAEFYDKRIDQSNIPLEYVWPYLLKGEESKLAKRMGFSGDLEDESFSYQFLESEACKHNKAATEYFFQKLTEYEKESILINLVEAAVCKDEDEYGEEYYLYYIILKHERRSDVLCYLLPMMEPEDQMEFLREHPVDVLSCLLDWPWHDLFLEATNIIWEFLPVSSYEDFYSTVINYGFYFPNVVRNLLRNGPRAFVKYFLKRKCKFCRMDKFPLIEDLSDLIEEGKSCCLDTSCFLADFFDNEDTETLKEVFRNASAKEKVNLVCSFPFHKFFEKLTVQSKWHLVELCLHEAIKSKKDKQRLKQKFQDRAKETIMKEGWQRFFNLINETEITPDERSSKRRKCSSHSKPKKFLITKECS